MNRYIRAVLYRNDISLPDNVRFDWWLAGLLALLILIDSLP